MARPKLNNVRVNFLLDPRQLTWFRRVAQARGTTYSELLRRAAREFIMREHKGE